MKNYFINEANFNQFVDNLIQTEKVVAPIAKKNKFIFDQLKSAQDLRLDYDVTLLPPKKVFFPPEQDLVKFNQNEYQGCIKPENTILFGVHFYDIKGIEMTDLLFQENCPDQNYLANRHATTIVGSNIQTISPKGFWGSVGKDRSFKGHDAFLTKITGGYLFEAITPKGENLVVKGEFMDAADNQVQEANDVNNSVLEQCSEKLNYSSENIAQKVRDSFSNDQLWDDLAQNCFSCGSCNIVCPTCYCFDIQDNWNLDQVSGVRTRTWDGCLTEDFAKVSLGQGATENFREKCGQRYRHRVMRKTTYLNKKLGSPACVGCGRCSTACTADIANPVNIINRVMEG